MTTATYQTGCTAKNFRLLKYNILRPHDSTCLTSRSCRAEAVANVNFKLCRSRRDGNKVQREISSIEDHRRILGCVPKGKRSHL